MTNHEKQLRKRKASMETCKKQKMSSHCHHNGNEKQEPPRDGRAGRNRGLKWFFDSIFQLTLSLGPDPGKMERVCRLRMKRVACDTDGCHADRNSGIII